MREAARATFDARFKTVYLCALPQKQSFYERLGWLIHERNIDPDDLTVLMMSAKP